MPSGKVIAKLVRTAECDSRNQSLAQHITPGRYVVRTRTVCAVGKYEVREFGRVPRVGSTTGNVHI
eukprot:scaffold389619_cov39-Prasinocladus_malaysianus.AAC.1